MAPKTAAKKAAAAPAGQAAAKAKGKAKASAKAAGGAKPEAPKAEATAKAASKSPAASTPSQGPAAPVEAVAAKPVALPDATSGQGPAVSKNDSSTAKGEPSAADKAPSSSLSQGPSSSAQRRPSTSIDKAAAKPDPKSVKAQPQPNAVSTVQGEGAAVVAKEPSQSPKETSKAPTSLAATTGKKETGVEKAANSPRGGGVTGVKAGELKVDESVCYADILSLNTRYNPSSMSAESKAVPPFSFANTTPFVPRSSLSRELGGSKSRKQGGRSRFAKTSPPTDATEASSGDLAALNEEIPKPGAEIKKPPPMTDVEDAPSNPEPVVKSRALPLAELPNIIEKPGAKQRRSRNPVLEADTSQPVRVTAPEGEEDAENNSASTTAEEEEPYSHEDTQNPAHSDGYVLMMSRGTTKCYTVK